MKITLFVILLFGFLSVWGHAQNIKIGDIAISDSLAKEYFLDCYTNPDTIQSPNTIEGRDNIRRWEEIESKAIERYWDAGNWYLIIPREPSAYDFMLYMNRGNRGIRE